MEGKEKTAAKLVIFYSVLIVAKGVHESVLVVGHARRAAATSTVSVTGATKAGVIRWGNWWYFFPKKVMTSFNHRPQKSWPFSHRYYFHPLRIPNDRLPSVLCKLDFQGCHPPLDGVTGGNPSSIDAPRVEPETEKNLCPLWRRYYVVVIVPLNGDDFDWQMQTQCLGTSCCMIITQMLRNT